MCLTGSFLASVLSSLPRHLALAGCALAFPTSLWAGTLTDDFDRPDSEMRALGGDWEARGDGHIVNGVLELLPDPNVDGQSMIEAISKTEETQQGDGRKFELAVDFKMPSPDSDGRVGLLFNWQSAVDFNSVYYEKGMLIFMAVRGGSGVFTQQQPLQMELFEGQWYRLKIASSDDVSIDYSISSTGSDPQVLDSVSVAMPEPLLTGGFSGLMNALAPIPLDNFSFSTTP